MDIIVLIKQVPNTLKVEIDRTTGNMIRKGVDSIINPDDLRAVEASIALREAHGGHITAISMGPPQSIDALSEVIGMGIDRGILLSDLAFSGADTWATSHTLGKSINSLKKYDLILCGHQAIDGDTAQVGPQVAAFLDIPQITCVFEIESINLTKIKVKCKTDEGYNRVQCDLPILLSVTSNMNEPRFPVISKLIAACQKNAPINVWNAADIGVKTSEVGMNGSLTQVVKTSSPDFERQKLILEGPLPKVVETLVNKIKENNLM